MRYDDLTRLVQRRARLASPDAAERATRATLETLSPRLPDALASDLTARLPREMGDVVRRSRRGPATVGTHVGGDDFVAALAERTLLDAPRAAAVARTVFGAVDVATAGALGSARPALAEDVRALVAPMTDPGPGKAYRR
jgi:uncharacterized protein (DUF2267 family)